MDGWTPSSRSFVFSFIILFLLLPCFLMDLMVESFARSMVSVSLSIFLEMMCWFTYAMSSSRFSCSVSTSGSCLSEAFCRTAGVIVQIWVLLPMFKRELMVLQISSVFLTLYSM